MSNVYTDTLNEKESRICASRIEARPISFKFFTIYNIEDDILSIYGGISFWGMNTSSQVPVQTLAAAHDRIQTILAQ